MSKLLNHLGEPIENKVDESKLPTTEQILKDPITKKFVFLNSKEYPDQTCIGLTSETDFHGVVYKYGKVTLPQEVMSDEELENNKDLPFKFKYDIIESNFSELPLLWFTEKLNIWPIKNPIIII